MQYRFHNYLGPLVSFDENRRITGAIRPAIYCGFDSLTPVAGVALELSHGLTGLQWVNPDGTFEGPTGCIVSRHGVFIYETEPVQIAVPLNPDSIWKKHLLVMNHNYIDSDGGATASYTVLQDYADQPLLSYQVALGNILVAPNSVNHNSTIFQKFEAPGLGGGGVFTKLSRTDLLTIPNSPQTADFNKVVESGLFHLSTEQNRPNTASASWMVFVLRAGNSLTQLAQASGTGKFYGRSASYNTTTKIWTFTTWVNFNNTDISVDLGNLQTQVGTLQTTVSGINTTISGINTSINNLETSINNLETSIGSRSYSEQNIILSGESLSQSLNKLDKTFGGLFGTTNLDSINYPGIFALFGTELQNAVGDASAGLWGTLVVTRVKPDSNVRLLQTITVDSTGHTLRRSSNNGGTTWGAWTRTGVRSQVFNIGVWNMDTDATKTVTLFTGSSDIASITGVIRTDAWASSPLSQTSWGLYPIPHFVSGQPQVWIQGIDNRPNIAFNSGSLGAKTVTLERLTGGHFDSAFYDNTTADFGAMNRGFLLVNYQ